MSNQQNTAQLEAYDPASGRLTATRTFPDAALVTASGIPGYVLRQEFNANFTEVIAQGPQQSDGSASAGMSDVSGHYRALTAPTSGGYGSPVVKTPLAFNPVTGRLWYEYTDSNGIELGSVDPSTGPSSDRPESPVTPADPSDTSFTFNGDNPPMSTDVGYFASDGFGPINFGQFDGSENLFLPGGTEVSGTGSPFEVGKEGQLTASTPQLPVAGTPTGLNVDQSQVVGFPQIAVSASSFITYNDLSAPTQLFLCTIGSGSINAVPLLPASNRAVGDLAIAPGGTALAFTSTAGNVTTLYTVSLTGSHALSQVAVLKGGPGRLLAWLS